MNVSEWIKENLKDKEKTYYTIELEIDNELNVINGRIYETNEHRNTSN